MSEIKSSETYEEEINWYEKYMMKKCIFILLVVLMICCFVGCGLVREPESGIEVEAQMIEYLEEKYGQKFEILYVSYGDFLHPEIRMGAYPEGGDSEIERFEIIREKVDGKNVFKDGYYGIFIREDYEEYIQDVVIKYFPNCKYYSDVLEITLDAALTKEVSLEEALEIQRLPVSISIFYIASDESKYTKIFNDFCVELSSFVPDVTVTFIGVEQDDFNNLTRKNYEQDIYKYNGNRYSKVNFFLKERWRNGEVQE